ncbi:GNAT family N-acetyltransferase [Pseudomonas sp. LTJR-52]|uniref:GNAT family N-acetyltransferase n=1 Tax=Pseudomonas sp. LTJR-52 TaxID=2479392 RepID=UPI000EFD23B3|nr:GNAT family N-acetyltransferase [Pseudomonas sp. LTJR-52]AYN92695.1 GNAT family N-acetyltransferase [Pseudomonas sp. LTJR-52]
MTSLTIRRATLDDLPSIVSLLANDTLGATREDNSLPLQAAYVQAFEAINADANQFLAVAVVDGLAVGTLQLSFLPYISHLGSWRAQIEAVRVHEQMRGSGLGRRLFEWAFDQARQRGCRMIQLTCDRARPDAHRFYESLGFTPSHTGFKMKL